MLMYNPLPHRFPRPKTVVYLDEQVISIILLHTAGIPLSGGSIGIILWAERLAQVRCTGNENDLSGCSFTNSSVSFIISALNQARVRCFNQEGEYLH